MTVTAETGEGPRTRNGARHDESGTGRRVWHPGWVDVCAYDALLPERGAVALVSGVQVALFRMYDGHVHAISNRDPFSGAYVLSRGIVGTRGERPIVASPMHKQAFDLLSGECGDDPAVRVDVFDVRVRAGRVEVYIPRGELAGSGEISEPVTEPGANVGTAPGADVGTEPA
ncbi:nitrite reductase small subunit NirD [Actinobacteria bacterium YIM 96077]|uniref:Nitrite reductase (NAD(P)H) small subunit n=1 Tax=Phytoactinopolyspora halophila TaxID=1981511 RepID=A0A329R2Y4_9ACTN|nr:nitrite reductase small subunit NirD [Phytoactinopolyspora halophila]AYY11865.1 nitrite reductase small subunit NirD [Actinobacteria bacterium YIM 96077]RAW18901.1 nitrite reductase (NAD(P)H) small subunit [Phytoactinopolyspora halophila]